MSSQYKLICLSHDPGIEIGPDDWYTAEQAIGSIALRSGPASDHKSCDLVIGRYSYPIIDVCCTGCSNAGYHIAPQWTRAGWLRLLSQSRQNDDQTDKLIGNDAGCWPAERLKRLAPLLGIEDVLA